MTNPVDSVSGWEYAVVDVADNSTVVYPGPALVRKAWVNTVLSAHACPIQDDTTLVRSFAASAAVNSELDFSDVTFETNITVDPNDAATGSIVVVFKPL